MKVLVLGASGGTGQQIVRAATAAGHSVVALVRNVAVNRDRLATAQLIEGDALDEGAIFTALQGCDAVICSLGTGVSPFAEVTLLSRATGALLKAMARRDVRRLVGITGLGAGDSRGHGGFMFDRLIYPILLRKVYQDKNRQEDVVRASNLDWVLVRPTVLNDKPARASVRALTDLSGIDGGTIARADVATFVVEQLRDDRWLSKAPLITWY